MTDLEAPVVAAYVFADDYPVPPRCGRPALVADAELVALAVAQAAIGISLAGPVPRHTCGLRHGPDSPSRETAIRSACGSLTRRRTR
jgi:hypothetical protein